MSVQKTLASRVLNFTILQLENHAMKFAFILAILMVASGASLIGRAMNSGSPNVEGKKMPAYGKKLSEQQINALVAFPKP